MKNERKTYYQEMFNTYDLLDTYVYEPSKKQPNWVDSTELMEANRQELVRSWCLNAARCYSNVFRDEPWEEAFQNQEGKFIGLNQVVDITQWREQRLTRAYPLKETQDYIQKEISRLNAVVVYKSKKTSPRQIYAFGWGYSFTSTDQLVEDKWSGSGINQKKRLSENISRYTENLQPWYLSEVGVLAQNRQKGTATELVAELVDKAPANLPLVMRTNANSPMTVIAENLGFKQILGPVTKRLDNQIVVSKSKEINGYDPINPYRVLYFRQPKERSDS